MDTKLVIGVIIFIILLSYQYTLNLILREIREIRISLEKEKFKDIR
jgi:hypothetical protein